MGSITVARLRVLMLGRTFCTFLRDGSTRANARDEGAFIVVCCMEMLDSPDAASFFEISAGSLRPLILSQF